LLEHFENAEDYRVHTREVNKRQKFQQEVKEYKPKVWFYVESKIQKGVFIANLYARIDMYDRYENKSNKVTPKLIKIDSKTCGTNESEMKKTKDLLWAESKSVDVLEYVEKESQIYLKEVKNKVVA
jgi:hypothetical protein